MKKYNNRLTFREMQDCLDSDDELPMTYTEESELPAYLDDARFDPIEDSIEFTWLNNKPKIHMLTQDTEDSSPVTIDTASETPGNQITPTTSPLITDQRTLIKKGIFKEWESAVIPIQTTLENHKEEIRPTILTLTADGRTLINKGLMNEQDSTPTSKHTASETHNKEITSSILPMTPGERTLIKKGILNQQDILCMKSFAAITTDDSALLWFIDFLITKDLQSDYKFLKSCLVPSQHSFESSSKMYSPTASNGSSINNKFELVVI